MGALAQGHEVDEEHNPSRAVADGRAHCQLPRPATGSQVSLPSGRSRGRNVQFSCAVSLLNYFVCSKGDFEFGFRTLVTLQFNSLPWRGKKKEIIKTEPEKDMRSTRAAKTELKPSKMERT